MRFELIAFGLLLIAAFAFGCVSTPTPVPSPSPNAPCTNNVTASCASGKTYTSYQCVDGHLKKLLYFVDPCPCFPIATANLTVECPNSSCTADVLHYCDQPGRSYVAQKCVDQQLQPVYYFVDPCA